MVYACLISCSLINKSKCHSLAYFNLRWTCVVILHKCVFHGTHVNRSTGTMRTGPDMRKTRPLMECSVTAKMALCTSGPRKTATDWTLCSSAYTEPASKPRSRQVQSLQPTITTGSTDTHHCKHTGFKPRDSLD